MLISVVNIQHFLYRHVYCQQHPQAYRSCKWPQKV